MSWLAEAVKPGSLPAKRRLNDSEAKTRADCRDQVVRFEGDYLERGVPSN